MVKMQVYLAGSSDELDLVERTLDRLRAAGIVITHDWTKIVRRAECGNPRELRQEDRRQLVDGDLLGILKADVFWLLVPERSSGGAWAKYGYALGLTESRMQRTIIVSGDWRKKSIEFFTSFAHLRFDSHDKAMQWLKGATGRAEP